MPKADETMTVEQIANVLEASPHQVRYAISQLEIEADRWVGNCRLFDANAVAKIGKRLKTSARREKCNTCATA